MLREDGLVDDDGTVTRISKNRYMISTTTLHAGAVISRLEYLSQVEWPNLDVHLLSVTDDWAGIGIAGPQSRKVLERLIKTDISNTALPFMTYAEVTITGIFCRLFRISFSGELAFEINMAPPHMCTIWEALLDAGANLKIIPYGSETMNILRIEKGHVAGGELNGRVTAVDLGFNKMLPANKPYIGRVLAQRKGLTSNDRPQLIGLIPIDGKTRIPRGAQLVDHTKAKKPVSIVGEVTSQCMSPNLGYPIGLGLLRGGRKRQGETVQAHSPLTQQTVAVKITNPIFIDPDGKRLRV